MTPEDSWAYVKPNVSYLKVICSQASVLIPYENHNSMEKKSQPLFFVGYYEDMKAYNTYVVL